MRALVCLSVHLRNKLGWGGAVTPDKFCSGFDTNNFLAILYVCLVTYLGDLCPPPPTLVKSLS